MLSKRSGPKNARLQYGSSRAASASASSPPELAMRREAAAISAASPSAERSAAAKSVSSGSSAGRDTESVALLASVAVAPGEPASLGRAEIQSSPALQHRPRERRSRRMARTLRHAAPRRNDADPARTPWRPLAPRQHGSVPDSDGPEHAPRSRAVAHQPAGELEPRAGAERPVQTPAVG